MVWGSLESMSLMKKDPTKAEGEEKVKTTVTTSHNPPPPKAPATFAVGPRSQRRLGVKDAKATDSKGKDPKGDRKGGMPRGIPKGRIAQEISRGRISKGRAVKERRSQRKQQRRTRHQAAIVHRSQ